MKKTLLLAAFAAFATSSFAQVLVAGPGVGLQAFRGAYGASPIQASNMDLINGNLGVEGPDNGWHPAIAGNPALQRPVLTNGIYDTDLGGLLNDFPGAGNPTKVMTYALGGAYKISSISVISSNPFGFDGRVFHTYTVETSTDGANYGFLAYVQSANSGALNGVAGGPRDEMTATRVSQAVGFLAMGVTHVRIKLYSVDNTQGQNRDPFDGVNPFTGVDDGLTAAFNSPLIREIDIEGVPEPGTMLALGAGIAAIAARRRRKA